MHIYVQRVIRLLCAAQADAKHLAMGIWQSGFNVSFDGQMRSATAEQNGLGLKGINADIQSVGSQGTDGTAV
jgi:hypothetical protein